MAGALNGYGKKDCLWYSENVFNGYKANIGLKKQKENIILRITVFNDNQHETPANFSAIVKNSNDVKNLLDVALSFRFKK